jgi:hypothetical protein
MHGWPFWVYLRAGELPSAFDFDDPFESASFAAPPNNADTNGGSGLLNPYPAGPADAREAPAGSGAGVGATLGSEASLDRFADLGSIIDLD